MNKETLEEAAKKAAYDSIEEHKEFPSIKAFIRGSKWGAEWMQERTISKEAYEDSLSMQKCSNAGYESKIRELKSEIERMYSEEEVLKLLVNFSNDRTFLKKDVVIRWFEQFKKK